MAGAQLDTRGTRPTVLSNNYLMEELLYYALRLSAANFRPVKLVPVIIYLPGASQVLSLMTPR
jgi:hypothetical protein